MSPVKKLVNQNKFLSFVILGYIILFVYKMDMSWTALKNSAYYFKEMLVIMPVIMLLTALLEAWVPKQAIEKHLGANAGFKGQVFSFLLGSFSAGPIYAAFPVCIALLKKGASIANIVILLSTWAVVKVPMLANEANFLSPQFMLVRWVLTTISIFIIGAITSRFVKRADVLALHDTQGTSKTSVTIQKDYCIGCGICTKLSPNCFAMENGKAVVLNPTAWNDVSVKKAADSCPAKAISLPNQQPNEYL